MSYSKMYVTSAWDAFSSFYWNNIKGFCDRYFRILNKYGKVLLNSDGELVVDINNPEPFTKFSGELFSFLQFVTVYIPSIHKEIMDNEGFHTLMQTFKESEAFYFEKRKNDYSQPLTASYQAGASLPAGVVPQSKKEQLAAMFADCVVSCDELNEFSRYAEVTRKCAEINAVDFAMDLYAFGIEVYEKIEKQDKPYLTGEIMTIRRMRGTCPNCGGVLVGTTNKTCANCVATNVAVNAPKNSQTVTYNRVPPPTVESNKIKTNNATSWERKMRTAAVAVILIIVAFVLVIGIISSTRSQKAHSNMYSTEISYPQESSDYLMADCTVTLDSSGGVGGTTSVMVDNGDVMPDATAPARHGYMFMGYYSSPDGGGTQYYDADMNGVHNWDKNCDSTLYAYWKKVSESQFSQGLEVGSSTYADIVSIEPSVGVYTSFGDSDERGILTSIVCACETSSGPMVYVCMSVSEYSENIDSDVTGFDLELGYYDTVTFSPEKRIYGTVTYADAICDSLSDTTGELIIEFSSLG